MPIFMKYDGIDGDVTAKGHEKWIELQSYSMGCENARRAGSGGGTGKVSFSDLSFTKRSGKSSALLMLACANGKSAKQVIVENMRNVGGGGQEVFQRITLEDVVVSSYQVNAEQGSVPHEELSLNFTKIKFEQRVASPTAANQFETMTWNLKTNSP